jgi:hypothetical protein
MKGDNHLADAFRYAIGVDFANNNFDISAVSIFSKVGDDFKLVFSKQIKQKPAMNKNERIEIDFESLELTEGEKTSLLCTILKERQLELKELDHTNFKLTKEEITRGIKELSEEEQNELMVSATDQILKGRMARINYLRGVASDAHEQSNSLMLSAKILQEKLICESSKIG